MLSILLEGNNTGRMDASLPAVSMAGFLESRFPVKVERREGRGRCVIAAKDIRAGTLVLSSMCAAVSAFPVNCSNCIFSKGASLCTGCRAVRYCSKDCQIQHWNNVHKRECKRLKDSPMKFPFTASDALMDALLLMRLEGGACLRPADAAVNTGDGDPYYVHCLQDVRDMQKPSRSLPNRESTEGLAYVLVQNKLIDGDETEAADTLQSFVMNDFLISDDIFVGRAAAVNPCGALLNHSCAPNCVPSYAPVLHNGKAVHILQNFRTIRNVAAGEELCHAYVEIAMPKEVRHRRIEDVYGFECTCAACATDIASYDAPLDSLLSGGSFPPLIHASDEETRTILLQIEAASKTADKKFDHELLIHALPLMQMDPELFAAAAIMGHSLGWTLADRRFMVRNSKSPAPVELLLELQLLEHSIHEMRKTCHAFHSDIQGAVASAFNRYMMVGDMIGALWSCEYMVAFYRKVYRNCPSHPMLGLQLYSLADLYSGLATLMPYNTEPFQAKSTASVGRAEKRAANATELDAQISWMKEVYHVPESWTSSTSLVDLLARDVLEENFPAKLGMIAAAKKAYKESAYVLQTAWGGDHPMVKTALHELKPAK